MISKISIILDIFSNMGLRYVLFRILYFLKTKLGWYKKNFPVNLKLKKHISLQDWKDNMPPFFFYGKEIKGLNKQPSEDLKNNLEDIKKN